MEPEVVETVGPLLHVHLHFPAVDEDCLADRYNELVDVCQVIYLQ
jgi:hypothetical protein